MLRKMGRIEVVLCLAVHALAASPLPGDGNVTGRVRFERIKGQPSMGYAEIYETNLFLCPDDGATIGRSFRVGAPPGQVPTGDGFYRLTVPAGTYSLVLDQPLFFIRPKVVTGVTVTDGRTTTQHVELPIDYSTYFTDSWTGFDRTWAQTFVATGTSITGVSWRLAGTNATQVEARVLKEVAGESNPLRWRLVSSRARRSDTVTALADNWVRWRSGEVPTVPGGRYAIVLTGVSGGSLDYAIFKRDKDARSYSSGRAYDRGGRAQGFDLNITVFSDNDGTAILYNKTTGGLGELRDGYYGGRWGQTFKATQGSSLAAVEVWAAGSETWDLDFTFSVYQGGPGGGRVGPTKTTKAAFQAFGAGLHAVSYSPGEVPLTPGEVYYVEFTNSQGYNPYVMGASEDSYPDGAAYQDRSLRDGGVVDLSMTIVVHDLGGGGTVRGVVSDGTDGRPLGGVTVTVVEIGRSASTVADGSYEISNVQEGAYTLRASKSGYESESRSGVSVEEGGETSVHFSLDRESCGLEFRNEGFEAGMTAWTRYGDARDRVVDTAGGVWFGGIVAREGRRFHGNEINGCCMNGGLYQSFCAVPGHRYRITAWSNVYWISGGSSVAVNRLGIDPDGGNDATSGAIVWSTGHRQPVEATQAWRRLAVGVEAGGPVMTVFLDFKQGPSGGNTWRINCFDLVQIEDLDAGIPPQFRRGDCNDDGRVDISDAISTLGALFLGEGAITCQDACDSSDDGTVDVTDPITTLGVLFLGQGNIPPPGVKDCGVDPTGDGLACEAYDVCGP